MPPETDVDINHGGARNMKMNKRAARTKRRAQRLEHREARRERRKRERKTAWTADSEVSDREHADGGASARTAESAWFIVLYTFDNGTPAIHRFHLVGEEARSLPAEDVVNLAARGLPRTPDGSIGLLSFDSERECKAEYDRLKSSLADVGVRWTKAPPHRAHNRR